MTIWVPDLDRSKPLYVAIADAIENGVANGSLATGQRLPPQRELAWKLGVTLGTVTRAYKEAENKGLLSGEVGRGSYIKAGGANVLPLPYPHLGTIDLTQAIPPPVVSHAEFDAALQHIMRSPDRLSLLDYAPPEGHGVHRAMAAGWLKRSGIDAQEKNIFITAGAHLGLVTTLEALREPGDSILAEDINYAQLRQLFRNVMLETSTLPMDENGMQPDALEAEAAKGKARLVYLVPTLQNPTTSTMSRQRREDIVAVARKYDLTIIEDDIFRLLDDRVQAPTLYALAPERTFHISSLSKTLAPGLRMGFVLAPQGQDRALRAHIRSMAPRTVGLMGEVARYWIESDVASSIVLRTRAELSRRREAFLEVFKGHAFSCSPAAPYAWLKVPEPWSGGRFASAAARQIRISPGSIFDLGGRGAARDHVRICFGAPANLGQCLGAFSSLRELLDHPPDDEFTPVA